MAKTSDPIHTVFVSSDPQTVSQLEGDDQNGNISLVKDFKDLRGKVADRSVDGLVLGENEFELKDLASLNETIDLSRTAVIAGPVPPFEAASQLQQILGNGKSQLPVTVNREPTLEDYVESKLGDFVRAMKLSSARSLYPTFMRAVERPLIELALRETNGNQIQASQLLGMNRNTLRKKLQELKIEVKRKKPGDHSKT